MVLQTARHDLQFGLYHKPLSYQYLWQLIHLIYEGEIIGECNKDEDLAVNVIKAKQMTNQRSANKDTTVVLKRPRTMGLEACMEYINDDELVEITPRNIRLRKKILNTEERKKFDSKKKKQD